jgi:hypothetical protein
MDYRTHIYYSVREAGAAMSDSIPACVCSIHPKGEDRSKYMFVAECTSQFVVFCCRRCSEISHEAVIQVRTLRSARDKARYEVAQQRRQMDPRLLRMLEQRKRGRVRYKEASDNV